MSDKNTKRKKKRKNLSYIMEIALCVIALAAITFSMIMLVKYYQLQQRAEELQAEIDVYTDPEDPYLSRSAADSMIAAAEDNAFNDGKTAGEIELLSNIKSTLLDTDNSMETLKEYFPEELIVVDHEEVIFFPILDSLRHHPYEKRDFVINDSGRTEYIGSICRTETWIDVSKFQEKINWSKVSQAGIDAAIVRLGYRGYSKGDIIGDETFEDNIEGALDHGLKAGVYFLTQATSDSEALEEAEYVLDHIDGYDIQCPVVLDVELVGGDEGRGNALSMSERTEYAITFLDTIREAGYDVCIYGNLKTFLLMLDMQQLEDYDKWFAGYTDTPYFPYEMNIWQYTDTGRIDGISGNVDINIRFLR